tara:strand:+ start:800 stop:964 length:165 start_codon:yes stop_codon:yes gene_type:complete
MKIGDLIRWKNRDKEYELGVVTKVSSRQAMVWFFADCALSMMTIGGLEVINESR